MTIRRDWMTPAVLLRKKYSFSINQIQSSLNLSARVKLRQQHRNPHTNNLMQACLTCDSTPSLQTMD